MTSLELPQSYTCPYCSRMGFTDVTLQEHVSADHADTSFEVVSRLYILFKHKMLSKSYCILGLLPELFVLSNTL